MQHAAPRYTDHVQYIQAVLYIGFPVQAKLKEIKESAAVKVQPSASIRLLCASRLVSLVGASRQTSRRAQGRSSKKADQPSTEDPTPSTSGASSDLLHSSMGSLYMMLLSVLNCVLAPTGAASAHSLSINHAHADVCRRVHTCIVKKLLPEDRCACILSFVVTITT